MIKCNKTKCLKKCTNMDLRGIPTDKDGKPLVIRTSESLKKEELVKLVGYLGNEIPKN